MYDFQVSAWPAEAYEHEPAYGFFQRLAGMNCQISVRPFAEMLGLNMRYAHFEELLDFCLTLPSRGKDNLRHATPKIDSHMVEINGQRLRNGRQWSWGEPRVCPGCLYEKPYYRNWFDIQQITSCPFHGAELISGIGDDRLRNYQTTVGVLPVSGAHLAVRHENQKLPETLDRYLLGRLGAATPLAFPILDDLELFDVIDFTGVIGLMAQFGWRASSPRSDKSTMRNSTSALGFNALVECNGQLKQLLERYAASSPVQRHRSSPTVSFGPFWGWLGKTKVSDDLWRKWLGASIDEISKERSIYRKSDLQEAKLVSGRVSVREIAAPLKTPSATVKAVAAHLRQSVAKHRTRIYYDRTAAEQITAAIKSLVPRHKIPFAWGISTPRIDKIIREHELRPAVQAKAEYVDQFLAAEVLNVGERLDTSLPRLPARWRWDPTSAAQNPSNAVSLSDDQWGAIETAVLFGCDISNRSNMRNYMDNILTVYRNGLGWRDLSKENGITGNLYACWNKMNLYGKWDNIMTQMSLRPDLFG